MSGGAITGLPEVDGMTPGQAFHAGRKLAAANIERLQADLDEAHRCIGNLLAWVNALPIHHPIQERTRAWAREIYERGTMR